MTVANWLQLLGSLLTLAVVCVAQAVAYGRMQAKLATLETLMQETRSSDTRQGERMGKLESRVDAIEAVDRERIRTATGAHQVGKGG